LGEVVVTASRNDQLLGSTLLHTTVISRQDIERAQTDDLVTLLQREAGLQRTQNGGLGTVSSVFMRGAPSLQTLVLIDGVPLNKQDASGAVSLEHLMLDSVERVEIVRGNVSAIYGSGAIGGVIQIFTRRAGVAPGAKVAFESGAHGTRKLGASVSAGGADTTLNAGVTRLVSGGFSAINPAQFSNANPDADGYRNTSAHLSLVHKLSKDQRFGLRATRTDADAAYDNAWGAPTDVQSAHTRLNQVALFSDNTWGDWRSRLTWSEQSDTSDAHDNGAFGSNDAYLTRARVLSWVNSVALSGDWLASTGLEWQQQHVDTRSDSVFATPYQKDRLARAAWAGLEAGLGRGNMQINVRHDSVGELGKNTGFLGFSHPLTDTVKITASASTAFNAPPLGYLYAPGFGNTALLPERARSHEVGLQYERGRQWLRATYFDTRVQDQLDYDFVTSKFQNLGLTRNDGLEVSYRASYASTEVRASLTRQDPRNELTGQRLGRRAQMLWSLGVTHTQGPWLLGAEVNGSADRPDRYTDTNTFTTVDTTLTGYTVLDLSLAYRVSPTVQIKARLDNVADISYQTVYGYNQQPRSAYVGLTWTPLF